MDEYYESIEKALRTLEERGLQPNFFFKGDSVLHMAAFNAFIMKQQESGVDMCGVVCNSIWSRYKPQFGENDAFSVEKSKMVYIQSGIDYLHSPREHLRNLRLAFHNQRILTEQKALLTQARNGKADEFFYLITPAPNRDFSLYWLLCELVNKPIKFILIEEGIGSYREPNDVNQFFMNVRTVSRTRKEKAILTVKSVLRAPYYAFINRNNTAAAQTMETENFTLLRRNSGKLEKNEDAAFWMEQSLREQARIWQVPSLDFTGTVWLMATNFLEFGSGELEVRTIEQIIRAIGDAGLKVYFRPHPRTKNLDYYSAIGVRIDPWTGIPAETILMAAKTAPAAIVGFCSSTQVFANALWGIPCFNAGGILRQTAEESGESNPAIEYFSNTGKEFSDFISRKDTPQELTEQLARLKGQEAE